MHVRLFSLANTTLTVRFLTSNGARQFHEAQKAPPRPSGTHEQAQRPWKGDGFERHPDWQLAMQKERRERRAAAEIAKIKKPWQKGPSEDHRVSLKPWKDQKDGWADTLAVESKERANRQRDAFINQESSEVNMPGRPTSKHSAPNSNTGWDPAYEIGQDVAEIQQLEADCSRRRVKLMLHTLQEMLSVGQHCQVRVAVRRGIFWTPCCAALSCVS
jgi:hypothetical protein